MIKKFKKINYKKLTPKIDSFFGGCCKKDFKVTITYVNTCFSKRVLLFFFWPDLSACLAARQEWGEEFDKLKSNCVCATTHCRAPQPSINRHMARGREPYSFFVCNTLVVKCPYNSSVVIYYTRLEGTENKGDGGRLFWVRREIRQKKTTA